MNNTARLIMFIAALTTAELGVATAEAAMITWHWAGPVTGYVTAPGPPFGGPSLETVVPLGTTVDVFVSLDPDDPYLNPSSCLQGMASASLQVLGQTYTNGGFVWVDAMGFGPGVCAPAFNNVEIVVPAWGYGGPPLPGVGSRSASASYLGYGGAAI